MADRIDAVMATAIALDVSPAERSLRNLKNSVDIVNRSVQNQAELLRISGEGYRSAKTKVDGLNDVMERQQKVIDRLTRQQSDQSRIAQNQAKNIADLTEKIKQAKAERDAEAKVNGKATEAYRKLTEQIKQNQKALRDTKGIDRALNSTTRQLEIAKTKMLNYQRQQQSATREMNEIRPTGWHRVGSAIDHVNGIMNRTKEKAHTLRDVMAGTFLGNTLSSAASSAWNGIKMSVGGAVATGYKFNEQQQAMKASWDTLTGSASKGQDMVDMTNSMAASAQNSTKMVDQLNQKFYAVTNSKDKTKELSESVLKLQDAFNVSDDAVGNFATQWSQMVGNGKASAQDMLSIQNVFPKFREELLKYEQQVTHNKDLTMQQMNDMMSKGQISADAMNHVLISMGQEYKNSTQNFAKTLPGMARTVKAMMPRLLGEATKPLTEAASPVYQAVSKWVSDPATDNKFKQLGKKVQSAMTTVMRAFGVSNMSNTTNVLNNMIDSIGNNVQKVAQWIARNAQNIKASFALIKSIIHLAFSAVSAAAHVAINALSLFTKQSNKSSKSSNSMASKMKSLSKVIDSLSKNQKKLQTIMKVLMALFVAGKIIKFAVAVKRLAQAARIASTAQWLLNVAMDANPVGLAVMAVSALVLALGLFAKWCFDHKTLISDWIKSQFAKQARWGRNIKNFFTKTLPRGIKAGASFVRKAAKAIVEAIEWPFKQLFKWLIGGFKNIAKKIKNALKIGGKKMSGVPGASYATGTSGTTEDQVALVNDAQSKHFREMMLYKGNLYRFPNRRNIKAYIPAGAEVIDGEASHKLAKQRNLPHYASGTSGASQLSSLVNGLNAYGNGNRQQIAKKFLVDLTKKFNDQLAKFQQQIQKANQEAQQAIEKTRKELAQKLAEYRQRLAQSMAETNKQLHQSESEASKSLGQQKREAEQERMHTLADHKGHSAEDIKAIEKEQQKYAKSMNSAYASFWKSIDSARSSAEKSAQTARASFSKSTATARNSADLAIKKAQQHQSHVVNLANQNINRLKEWRQSNINQMRSGMAEFADGGLANRPSIFGEAGLEAAIPLDQMKSGSAWQTLAKVVSYYAGNTDNVNQPTNSANNDSQTNAVLANKLDTLIGLMEQFVSGQADQIKATKGINGYDSNRAFNDFSSNFRTAQAGNLTY